VIAFEATTQWSRIAPGKGRLKQFMTPKTLP
jgi:hypothetical protein